MRYSSPEKGGVSVWAAVFAALLTLIVVAYVLLLLIPQKREEAAARLASAQLDAIQAAVVKYRAENGRVPGSLTEVTTEDLTRYTYVVFTDLQSYELCTRDAVPKGKKQCYSE